jgi:endo-alpha-1,4-polygalactosaminidase (GH114 family)
MPALRGAAAAGIPVLTIDFASDPRDAAGVYASAQAERFVAYVTARTRAGLTTTPPPGL